MLQNKEWKIIKIVNKSKKKLLTKASTLLVLMSSQNKTYDLLLIIYKSALLELEIEIIIESTYEWLEAAVYYSRIHISLMLHRIEMMKRESI